MLDGISCEVGWDEKNGYVQGSEVNDCFDAVFVFQPLSVGHRGIILV